MVRPLNENTKHELVIPKKAVPVLRQFFNENPSLMYRFLMKRIVKGLQCPAQHIVLYYLGDEQIEVVMRFDQYPIILQNAQKHFIKNEEYELAEQCKLLLIRYNVELVIQESRKVKSIVVK